jgi:hypothetical protein
MSDDDRDPQNGRFLPGNPGGPGRPGRTIEADYLAALSEAVPMEAWRAVVAKALEQAQNGNPKSRAWLGAYLIGRPTGDALLTLAAAEMAGYDPVEGKASDLSVEKLLTGLWCSEK